MRIYKRLYARKRRGQYPETWDVLGTATQIFLGQIKKEKPAFKTGTFKQLIKPYSSYGIYKRYRYLRQYEFRENEQWHLEDWRFFWRYIQSQNKLYIVNQIGAVYLTDKGRKKIRDFFSIDENWNYQAEKRLAFETGIPLKKIAYYRRTHIIIKRICKNCGREFYTHCFYDYCSKKCKQKGFPFPHERSKHNLNAWINKEYQTLPLNTGEDIIIGE